MLILLLQSIPAILLLLGIVLFIRGMRGRRVGDHPYCARCGFDLFNRAAQSDRCPECGSDLTLPKATRIGERVRRARSFAAGLVIIALGFIVGGWFAWSWSRNTNFNSYKPTWWLAREMEGGAPAVRDLATTELISRLLANELSQSQIDDLADRILSVQGDRSRVWSPLIGDLFQAAHGRQAISEERWKRYALQAVDWTIQLRPRVRRGDPLPAIAQHGPSRVGSNSSLVPYHEPIIASTRDGIVNVSGETFIDPKPIGDGFLEFSHMVHHGATFDLTPVLDRLADGTQTFRLVAQVDLREGWSAKSKSLGTTTLNLSGTFVLTPSSQPTVKIVRDESLRPAVENKLAVTKVTWDGTHLNTQYDISKPPFGLAYRLVMRSAGKETNIGGYTWHPGLPYNSFGDFALLKEPPPKVIDVIFRPDASYAARTIDTFDIWDGEITFRDIPVQYIGPATQATTGAATQPKR